MAKVNVLTVGDVKIKRWCWWSSWVDIAVYDHNVNPHLIQMKISRSNSKKFRSINMMGWKFGNNCRMSDIVDLTQMKPDKG